MWLKEGLTIHLYVIRICKCCRRWFNFLILWCLLAIFLWWP